MRMEVNAAYGGMAETMASIPDRFEAEGTLLYKGRNTIKRFDDGGVAYVVKRFRRPMFVQRVVYTFFRPGKARRAYHYGLRLKQLGFATPESIAYLETRSGGLLDQSYYICRVDDAPPICERLNDPEEFDRVMAADLARMLANLHQKGVLHGDFNSTNVLYRPQADGHYAFSLIDNNRMLRGDYRVKPTAYWFVNCEPTHGRSIQFDKLKEKKTHMTSKGSSVAGVCSEERSMISPDYARNFICDFIIGKEQEHTERTLFDL